jgi:hypothetical protein
MELQALWNCRLYTEKRRDVTPSAGRPIRRVESGLQVLPQLFFGVVQKRRLLFEKGFRFHTRLVAKDPAHLSERERLLTVGLRDERFAGSPREVYPPLLELSSDVLRKGDGHVHCNAES